ncbi:hypothetical protein ACIGGF_23015 [Rhodococcus sp. NPDC078407]|uniref:hypothetical protein n=1 Tax=Rhodococcus sp. NPDC078407 TaxID=3364509 RepID=UPI0037CBD667
MRSRSIEISLSIVVAFVQVSEFMVPRGVFQEVLCDEAHGSDSCGVEVKWAAFHWATKGIATD